MFQVGRILAPLALLASVALVSLNYGRSFSVVTEAEVLEMR